MNDVKLSIEANSLTELLNDVYKFMEKTGAAIVKSTDELPDVLFEILKTKGIQTFKKGSGVSDDILKYLLEEDNEKVINYLLENKLAFNRIIERLKEKGYDIQPGENAENNWG